VLSRHAPQISNYSIVVITEEELALFFVPVKAHTVIEMIRNNPMGAATK
jgi:hypothetical protein